MDIIFNYTQQEKEARRLLINEGLETAKDVAVMTAEEVSKKIQEHYEVIFTKRDDKIILIKKKDMPAFKSIARFLMR